MKKYLALFLVCALSLAGCGEKEITTMQIGSDANGYITVAGDWAEVVSEDSAKTSFSREEEDGYTYITFDTINMRGTDESLYTLEYTRHAYRDFYTDAGMTRVGVNNGLTAGSYDASAVNGYFTEDEAEKYGETFVFYDEADDLHLITIEGEKENVKAVEEYIATFTYDVANRPEAARITETESGEETDAEIAADGGYSPYEE